MGIFLLLLDTVVSVFLVAFAIAILAVVVPMLVSEWRFWRG